MLALYETDTHPDIQVDQINCYRYAESIHSLRRFRHEDDPFALGTEEPNDQIQALIYLVAICDRINWNFLLGQLAKSLWVMTDGFDELSIRDLTIGKFQSAFHGYKRDDGSLHIKRRFDSMKELSDYLRRSSTIETLKQCKSVLGTHGALSILRKVPVYRADPMHKKTIVLINELLRRDHISVNDSENIVPAVDYHLIRLYLRTGRLKIRDRNLTNRLMLRQPVRIEVITRIRAAVASAMHCTAWHAGVSIPELNELEWTFARQACRRDITWCTTGITCPVANVCESRGRAPSQMLTEPDSKHGHY